MSKAIEAMGRGFNWGLEVRVDELRLVHLVASSLTAHATRQQWTCLSFRGLIVEDTLD